MRTSFYNIEQHLIDAIEESNDMIRRCAYDSEARAIAIRAKVEAVAQLIELRRLERAGG